MLSVIPRRGFSIARKNPALFLSDTQRKIVLSLSEGKTLDEISATFGLAKRTLDFYMLNIMKVMRCDDASELAGQLAV